MCLPHKMILDFTVQRNVNTIVTYNLAVKSEVIFSASLLSFQGLNFF